MAITSLDRPPTLPSVSSIADRTASACRRLFSNRSGTTLPGASSRAEHASRPFPSSARLPDSIRSDAISHASLGLAELWFELIDFAENLSINQSLCSEELQ